MRILHELQMGRKVRHLFPPAVPFDWSLVPKGIDAAVTADQVAAWYHRSGKTRWSLRDEFGPMRLPFDVMWIEFTIPSDIHMESAIAGQSVTGSDVGCVLVQLHNDTIMTRTVSRVRGHDLIAEPFTYQLRINGDGSFNGWAVSWDADDATLEGVTGRSMAELMDHCAPHEALLAVGMSNCRNVTLGDERVAKQAIRSMGRKSIIPYKLNSLIIPGFQQTSTRSAARAATGAPIPLHLVRGHFKTFTEEAPLFGSRTGTFWWGWQTRGKKEHGVRDHEYVVSPPGDTA